MEINKETFTIQDLKQLLKEAFDFDYEKHKGKVKFFPLTIVEWYKSTVFKNNLSLNNINENIKRRYNTFTADGTYFYNQKSIAIFFRRSKIFSLLEYEKKSLDRLITMYVIVVFHELKHHYWHMILSNTIDSSEINLSIFSMHIGLFVHENNAQHYVEHHDEYLSEIDANLYGVERAYDFFKSKGMLTEERKCYNNIKIAFYLI